ncbi:hypothetical protein [Tahibacter harae]|uniref:Uncharacterized protein n=1 Tax=Tahibacter harae TaxID=2963937 RepID=A0ABT1QZ16_9GAMM|nr:hypothetical protein [Tahibacter harae]MCQ4167531.1 hypothetical protein [Tahibacter harae]
MAVYFEAPDEGRRLYQTVRPLAGGDFFSSLSTEMGGISSIFPARFQTGSSMRRGIGANVEIPRRMYERGELDRHWEARVAAAAACRWSPPLSQPHNAIG